jgi:hypothetical protein
VGHFGRTKLHREMTFCQCEKSIAGSGATGILDGHVRGVLIEICEDLKRERNGYLSVPEQRPSAILK